MNENIPLDYHLVLPKKLPEFLPEMELLLASRASRWVGRRPGLTEAAYARCCAYMGLADACQAAASRGRARARTWLARLAGAAPSPFPGLRRVAGPRRARQSGAAPVPSSRGQGCALAPPGQGPCPVLCRMAGSYPCTCWGCVARWASEGSTGERGHGRITCPPHTRFRVRALAVSWILANNVH